MGRTRFHLSWVKNIIQNNEKLSYNYHLALIIFFIKNYLAYDNLIALRK